MKSIKNTIFIIFCLILIAGQASAVVKSQTGTIILKDGTRYDNVIYKVDNQYKIISMDIEMQKINISFSQVSQILNTEGEDITAKMIDRPSEQQRETWKSTDHETYVMARKKLWHASLELNGNFSIPFGDYYEGITSGIGFGGQFTIAFSENLAGMIIFSKSGAKLEDRYKTFSYEDPTYIYSQENSFRILRYLVAVQYYNRPDRETPGKSIFYFYSGLGAVSEKATIDATIQNKSTGFIETYNDSETSTHFATTIGGGMIQMLGKQIGLDVGVSFDLIYVGKDQYSSSIQYAYLLDLKAGLIFFIGKD